MPISKISSYFKLADNDDEANHHHLHHKELSGSGILRSPPRRSPNRLHNPTSRWARLQRATLGIIGYVAWLWLLATVIYVSFSFLLAPKIEEFLYSTTTTSNESTCGSSDSTADAEMAKQNAQDFAEVSALVNGSQQCVFSMNNGQHYNFTSAFADTGAVENYAVPSSSGKKVSFRHPLIVHYIRIVSMLYSNDYSTVVNASSVPKVFSYSWQLDRLQYLAVRSAWKALLEAREYDKEQQHGTVDGGENETADDDADADVGAAAEPVIYIHSNIEPTGKYWNMLRDSKGVNVKWNYIAHTAHIGGFTPTSIEHEADFHKVNATYTFGGVHSDFDVLMVNGRSMRQLQYEGEVVMSVDTNYRITSGQASKDRRGYEYMLNCGFFSAVRRSQFLKLWRDMYLCDFRAKYWIFNSGLVPRMMYDVYKAQPLALDWHTGARFRIELVNEAKDAGPDVLVPSTWRTYPALHFYHVEHYKLDWQFMLRNSTSTLAQALRYVQFGTHEPQESPEVDWD